MGRVSEDVRRDGADEVEEGVLVARRQAEAGAGTRKEECMRHTEDKLT